MKISMNDHIAPPVLAVPEEPEIPQSPPQQPEIPPQTPDRPEIQPGEGEPELPPREPEEVPNDPLQPEIPGSPPSGPEVRSIPVARPWLAETACGIAL